MSQSALEFFNTHPAVGSVCLIGANDAIGRLVRAGQAALTPNGQPSLWSHSFLMGERRGDGRSDGSLYMFESDLQVSVKNWEVQNGAMESRLAKWCGDPTEHACVLGMNLSAAESGQVVTKALEYAYAENHLRYAVGELFGSLWAILTRQLNKKNVFDEKYAVQCATFVRMCYQAIGRDPLTGTIDLTHTSPEKLYQSPLFTIRQEWHR